MTASDPRVGEIQARRSSDPCPRHKDCSADDIAYLLAELRARDEVIAKVEALADAYAQVEWQDAVISPDQIRAAVAAANGGEDAHD